MCKLDFIRDNLNILTFITLSAQFATCYSLRHCDIFQFKWFCVDNNSLECTQVIYRILRYAYSNNEVSQSNVNIIITEMLRKISILFQNKLNNMKFSFWWIL